MTKIQQCQECGEPTREVVLVNTGLGVLAICPICHDLYEDEAAELEYLRPRD